MCHVAWKGMVEGTWRKSMKTSLDISIWPWDKVGLQSTYRIRRYVGLYNLLSCTAGKASYVSASPSKGGGGGGGGSATAAAGRSGLPHQTSRCRLHYEAQALQGTRFLCCRSGRLATTGMAMASIHLTRCPDEGARARRFVDSP